jgi:predicted amidohydrolase
VKVAALQHDIVWEDAPATFAHLAPMVAFAADDGVRLAVLSEMFSTGFSMNADRVAEAVDGPSTEFLVEQATAHAMWLCASVAIRHVGEDKPSNTCVLAAPDGTVHHYRKLHPFSYAGEHEQYAAGDAFATIDVDGLRCSLFVCYDLRFADEFWALAHDTDCYIVPANWPASRRDHWRTLLRARAIENQSYVVGVNRIGDGGGVAYVGDSAIIGPFGEELGDAGGDEAVVVADCAPAHVAAIRARYPFLTDRR